MERENHSEIVLKKRKCWTIHGKRDEDGLGKFSYISTPQIVLLFHLFLYHVATVKWFENATSETAVANDTCEIAVVETVVVNNCVEEHSEKYYHILSLNPDVLFRATCTRDTLQKSQNFWLLILYVKNLLHHRVQLQIFKCTVTIQRELLY